MARRIDARAPDFEAAFSALAHESRGTVENVAGAVSDIIAAVRAEGMDAVCRYTTEFDRFDADPVRIKVSSDDIAAARARLDRDLLSSLQAAADRITAFHSRQTPEDLRYQDEAGVELGWRWTPVGAAGLYAPGGRAAYPSSVLMNAIPAKAAGVGRIVMCVPTPDGVDNDAVLAAASIAGVDEIWRIGGAQAIAAMAYGAGEIAPVDVIVGPGNAYVAEAKRQVFGTVGIDAIAGPSEILVVADGANDPAWIAADLLSQAEHDPSSQSILITDDAAFADAVCQSADQLITESSRKDVTAAAWNDNSAVILVEKINDAPALVDRIAPEHLELAVADPEALLAKVRNAGAVFLGRHTPEALGDYVAGPNHVLPTSGAARYASGLSVLSFMKRTTIVGASPEAVRAIGPDGARLADAEGLPLHAASIRKRLS